MAYPFGAWQDRPERSLPNLPKVTFRKKSTKGFGRAVLASDRNQFLQTKKSNFAHKSIQSTKLAVNTSHIRHTNVDPVSYPF
jgi:hypothetical protein